VPNVDQPPGVIEGMKSMMSLTPALAGLVALAVFLFYPLNEKKVTQIESDLKARRAGGAVVTNAA